MREERRCVFAFLELFLVCADFGAHVDLDQPRLLPMHVASLLTEYAATYSMAPEIAGSSTSRQCSVGHFVCVSARRSTLTPELYW